MTTNSGREIEEQLSELRKLPYDARKRILARMTDSQLLTLDILLGLLHNE